MDIPEIERLVSEHLPVRFLSGAIRSIFEARKESHRYCKAEFAETEYTNVSPFHMRGKSEGLVRGVAELDPRFDIEVVQCSGWNHTEMTAGPIRLTVHAVEYPCAMVDRAEYRKSLAESQESFFKPEGMIPDAKLYALLLHGPYRGRSRKEEFQYRYLPGSIYLAFPEVALRKYAHTINLFERFPSLLESLLPKEWDSEAQIAYRYQAKQTKQRAA
jgi:hypothetical protein